MVYNLKDIYRLKFKNFNPSHFSFVGRIHRFNNWNDPRDFNDGRFDGSVCHDFNSLLYAVFI